MDTFIYKKSTGVTVLSASFADFKYKKHSHKEYALGVTLRGIQQYNLDGNFQSSYQNGVMLFNPEQPHDGMAHDKTGIDYVMVYIEPKLFLEILEKKDIVRFSSPIVYNYRLQQRILNLSCAILGGKAEALCSELLLSLADSFTQPNLLVSYRKDNDLTRKAKDMIHCSLENVLRLDDICRELDISKFQFIRMFKASTGISPYQYFLNCKIELAKQLIEKYKDVYSAVAECGFVDLTHLNKHFKSIYGITAFEYMSSLT
ncbi:AraC family transcriptional regulator [Desulfosporosinus fructosivorans]|uniref:AraC family transcriptional regulator n=1 Tax=Desulfosporosinus fructosivorans TaxID=2018669 RepID=A0A4Z0QYM3_9FIRM|nr:AraC family transcriptional regulator [Desulfosporosinus fructosivorans]TGE35608.1 AraC family transcriptional regulator [Desulfosporosinus fructosivorans]